uniref:Uncharacterized protein n=1 Tax=Urocitellus parryii TaxID=9999 RepID=A0A8D2HNZ7_UROPR
VQNDVMRFVLDHYLYTPRKCSTSNRTIDAKDHASIQISMTEVDKVTGRFNGQFKIYAARPFSGWVSHMTPFSNGSRQMAWSQRIFDWGELWKQNICYKY